MRKLYLLLLSFSFFSAFGQTQENINKRDTIIDFWNHQTYQQLHGYDNRVVESDNKILYVKVSFQGKSHANFEYFHINDSLFYCIGYYPSSNRKAYGNYIVSNNIAIETDTIDIENLEDGELISRTVIYYNKILKTGKWVEESDFYSLSEYGDYWEGEYVNGKKVGIWKHLSTDLNEGVELERVNYNTDSLSIYIKNLAYTSSVDYLEKLISGRWSIGCEDSLHFKMQLSKCKQYDGHYGDDCNDHYQKHNYYDFLNNGNFRRQRGDGCNKFKELSVVAKWKIIMENSDKYIHVNFMDSKENWKLKLIYLDKNGNLIIERQ